MDFDSVAAIYDEDFGVSPAGRLFRFRFAERVLSLAPPPGRVLDIGCGTGDDAVWLARQGYRVRGIDRSAGMIAQANVKAEGVMPPPRFDCLSLQEISAGSETFDVVISNFGALNCVPLPVWTELVPRLLSPGGRAFVVLMGPKPLPEGLRRGFRSGFRRRGAEVRGRLEATTVRYEPVPAVKEALRETAVVDHIEAMGCLVPGPGYSGFAHRWPISLGVLAMGESAVRAAPLFRNRGDHTLFEFRRR